MEWTEMKDAIKVWVQTNKDICDTVGRAIEGSTAYTAECIFAAKKLWGDSSKSVGGQK